MKRIAIAIALSAGCTGTITGTDGDDDPGQTGAFLTVIGDRNVFVEFGLSETLTVKYHAADGSPLAGAIEFKIQGDARGSTLSSAMGVTDAQGLARVQLLAGDVERGTFSVVAEAADTAPASWQVTLDGQNIPLAAVPGTYELESQFDFVAGIPGTTGDVVRTLIEMTDDPNDPATYFLDQAGGSVGDILDPFRPFIDGYLNDQLLWYAPEILSTFIDVGDDFGQVAQRFGVVSELEVTEPDPGALRGNHEVIGVFYQIDGMRYEYSAEELGLGEIQATNIPIGYENGSKLVLEDHELGISYGQMLLFALNHIIIPKIQPGADSIGDLLSRMVDCGQIGWDLAGYLGLGTIEAFLLTEGCDELLDEVGDEIEDAIRDIGGDNGTALTIHGDARVSDSDGDERVDRIANGMWEGEFRLGPISGPLARPDQRFAGQRMTVPGTP